VLKAKLQLHILPVTFDPINKIFPQIYTVHFHTLSSSSGRGINAKASAASELSDNFCLPWGTHHCIRNSLMDRLIKSEKCCFETEWHIDKSALRDGNK
jgi:hypothetical protein